MWATLLRAVAYLAILYLAIALFLWVSQSRLIFFAPKGAVPDPGAFGFTGSRVAVETADGVTLHGWYLSPEGPTGSAREAPAPALIWFYGNAENLAFLAPLIGTLRPPGHAMLVLDYRGYGQNGGRPNEDGLYRDADAAWEYLAGRPEIDPHRIAVFGRSLGSVPALYLADTRPVAAVILDSPFTTARAMARVHYRLFPSFLVRYDMDNLARARRLAAPLLIIHGTVDRIAPFTMGRALAEAGRAQAFYEVRGAGHNDVYETAGPGYRDTIHEFLEAVRDVPDSHPPTENR
ncbi:MAG: prolyl oligopeptidase family serine peptidase [Gemmatimonadales bacterium]|nr:prolyl oligopeptidase family serine peptidase [Gemmatimonadales bacterium]